MFRLNRDSVLFPVNFLNYKLLLSVSNCLQVHTLLLGSFWGFFFDGSGVAHCFQTEAYGDAFLTGSSSYLADSDKDYASDRHSPLLSLSMVI